MNRALGTLVLTLGLIAAQGASAPGQSLPPASTGPGFPAPGTPGWQAFRDSMLALPDSAWQLPATPGLDRKQMIAFMRRFFRSPDSLFVGPDSRHRSDAEMKRTFEAHRKEFDRLIAMFAADTVVHAVEDPTWLGIYDPPSPLPTARRKEYLRLFQLTGVRMMVRESRDLFLLRVTTVHTFDRKGYAWAVRRPRGAMNAIVEGETTRENAFRVFRRLGGSWYIYYQSNS